MILNEADKKTPLIATDHWDYLGEDHLDDSLNGKLEIENWKFETETN